MAAVRTEGPQSRAQPSLMGTSTTVTLGASVNAARASSADCAAQAISQQASLSWAVQERGINKA